MHGNSPVASCASLAVHSILLVGLDMGKMMGRALCSPMARSTSRLQILPAPVRPNSTVGLTAGDGDDKLSRRSGRGSVHPPQSHPSPPPTRRVARQCAHPQPWTMVTLAVPSAARTPVDDVQEFHAVHVLLGPRELHHEGVEPVPARRHQAVLVEDPGDRGAGKAMRRSQTRAVDSWLIERAVSGWSCSK